MDWTKNYFKAITLSYDDGILQDERFVKMLNQYNLKCTFNINTGFSRENVFQIDNHKIVHFDLREMSDIYKGHEIAIHSLTHPFLTKLTEKEIDFQLKEDILNIQKQFNIRPIGMAYPYGDYNDLVVEIVKNKGIKYARTVENNFDFKAQDDLLRFKPTCHHNDENIFDLIDQFLNSTKKEPQILYIWGHSYEFDVDDNWDHLEKICKKIAFHKDVFYGTNKEVLL